MLKTYSRDLVLLGLLIIIGCMMLSFEVRGSLDTKFYYSGEEARAFLSSLGVNGKANYLKVEILDFIFMFLYSWLAWSLMKKFYPISRPLHLLAILPGIFDNMENTTILYALKDPLGSAALDSLGVVTCLKWSSGAVLLAVLLVGIFRNQKTLPMALMILAFSSVSYAATWSYAVSEGKQPVRQRLDSSSREFRLQDRKCQVDEVIQKGDDLETRALICDLENDQKVTTIASCQTRGGRVINQNTGDLSFIKGTKILSVILVCE